MCGIAGYMGQGDRGVLEKMTNCLTHRGPDDSGFFVFQNVGLGHRRLSIIDLSAAGHQPMLSADSNIAIVFNGEIYNFQALRQDLEGNGYKLQSGSDTEVIIYLYAEYGLECFKKLNGMFAIGLYDKVTKRLILARDRLGKKPLYWSLANGALIFGSELKALMQHPSFKKEIDPTSLNKYLAFDYVPTPHTIFKNTYKLEPGTYLIFENNEIKKEKFWDISFGNNVTDLPSILREMDSKLEHAVVSRLVSDVPLGIFLSGGLDSSTIAYYAQKNSVRPIETFSISFEEKSFDESVYSRQVSKFLGTAHHEERLSAKSALDLIPRVADFIDEPVADYSIIPTYLLSQFTKKHVTVALGGDGGDELFFGYPTFQAEKLLPLARLAKPLLAGLEKLLPVSHAHFSARFQIHQLLQGLSVSRQYRHHAWMGTFIGLRTTDYGLRTTVFEDIDRLTQNVGGTFWWNRLVYLYMRTYLMDQVLVKVDRASMAASLEVRAPFLDYQFVDFVNSVPLKYRLHGFQTKWLLKELMKNKLPREIVYRKKQGFGVPLGAWFAGELKTFVLETLSETNTHKHGLFEHLPVEKIITDHMSLKSDNRKQLWSLLSFQLWYNKWMK